MDHNTSPRMDIDIRITCHGSDYPSIIIARERELGKKVEEYMELNDSYNLGIALGYPQNAVRKFANNDSSADAHPFFSIMSECIYQIYNGATLPISTAYLMHVPETLIQRNGMLHFDGPTKDIVESYKRCITSKNPALAELVERNFCNTINGLATSMRSLTGLGEGRIQIHDDMLRCN